MCMVAHCVHSFCFGSSNALLLKHKLAIAITAKMICDRFCPDSVEKVPICLCSKNFGVIEVVFEILAEEVADL